MATLAYDGSMYNSDNSTLAYINAVADSLFRDGKGFHLALFGTKDNGDPARNIIWMHPSIPVQYRYDSTDIVQLNGEMFEVYLDSAKLPGGVSIGGEPLPYSFEEANAKAALEADK